ncbi:hypothetical protein [Methanocrinis sp.]|uniref:hypothetical protein n=1 Tax=Methanocrinis sp. TaxID=3101522 RepID=UPI003D110E82
MNGYESLLSGATELEDDLSEWDEIQRTGPYCPICGGEGHLCGRLGESWHYRCRDCGMEWKMEG